MTTHPNTQTQHHHNPADPGDDHDIAPPAAHPDARDYPLVDIDVNVNVDVDVDREEIVPLGQRSPRPRPQTPPRKPCQPRALIATTLAVFVGLTIAIVALLALFHATTPPRRDNTVSPAFALSLPGAVAQPHEAAATPRPVRQQRELAAQRHAQQYERARRVAEQQRARDRRVVERNRRALAQRRRLATRNARARAAAWRRGRATSRRSTPTSARSHSTPPAPPARPACGEFDLC
jgi:hypothetical protein